MEELKRWWLYNPTTDYLVWTYATEEEARVWLRDRLVVADSETMSSELREQILKANFLTKKVGR